MSSNKCHNLNVAKLVELSKDDTSLITIEATVVTGFEHIAVEECQEKCKPLNICRSKGRIYFNIPIDKFPNVMQMRSVDNVFLVNDALGKIDLSKDKEKDLEAVKGLVDKVDWKSSLSTWAKLTEFEGILFPALNGSKEKLAEDLKKLDLDEKNYNLSGEKIDNLNVIINTNSQINPVLQTDSEFEKTVKLDEHLIDKTLKLDEELSERRNSSSSDDSFYSVEEAELTTADSGEHLNNTAAEGNKMKVTVNNIKTENQDKNATNKKIIDPNIIKFRATCNRTGEHSFSSMEAAWVFGGTLNDKFNWTVNLSHYDLNVILNISADRCYICSAITPKSLHRRNITHFGFTTLRPTMCYCMIRLAEPSRGEIIIDPLCGGGSIPIEGALGFPNTFHICGDNNDKAINRTVANINHISKTQPLLVDPLKWSAKRLPLKDECLDIFVTDLPFGKRSGKRSENLNLYQQVLTELARVIRCGTGRAVVLTHDKTSLTRALGGNNGMYWRSINSFGVNQGGLFSTVFLLLRTSKPFLF